MAQGKIRIELYKAAENVFRAACEGAVRIAARMHTGEVLFVNVLKVRDPKSFRRYWKLMTLCADSCERIELPYGGVFIVNTKDDVHTAIKLCTGHCDTIFDAAGKPVYAVPRPTNFEDMEGAEWEAYWPRVTACVNERIMPGVPNPTIQTEITRLMGFAS